MGLIFLALATAAMGAVNVSASSSGLTVNGTLNVSGMNIKPTIEGILDQLAEVVANTSSLVVDVPSIVQSTFDAFVSNGLLVSYTAGGFACDTACRVVFDEYILRSEAAYGGTIDDWCYANNAQGNCPFGWRCNSTGNCNALPVYNLVLFATQTQHVGHIDVLTPPGIVSDPTCALAASTGTATSALLTTAPWAHVAGGAFALNSPILDSVDYKMLGPTYSLTANNHGVTFVLEVTNALMQVIGPWHTFSIAPNANVYLVDENGATLPPSTSAWSGTTASTPPYAAPTLSTHCNGWSDSVSSGTLTQDLSLTLSPGANGWLYNSVVLCNELHALLCGTVIGPV